VTEWVARCRGEETGGRHVVVLPAERGQHVIVRSTHYIDQLSPSIAPWVLISVVQFVLPAAHFFFFSPCPRSPFHQQPHNSNSSIQANELPPECAQRNRPTPRRPSSNGRVPLLPRRQMDRFSPSAHCRSTMRGQPAAHKSQGGLRLHNTRSSRNNSSGIVLGRRTMRTSTL
jgi:hypothetical protein